MWGGKYISNGLQQHTMIIYIRISSEVTNTSTLLLNRKVFSLFTVINTSSQVFIAESSSQSHRVIIIVDTIIILLLIIEQYYLLSEVSTKPTLFHVRCGPSPQSCLHHISSKPSHRNYPWPSLHCHENNLCLLPLSRSIQIIPFVLSQPRWIPCVFYHHRSKSGYFHIIKTTCILYYERIT